MTYEPTRHESTPFDDAVILDPDNHSPDEVVAAINNVTKDGIWALRSPLLALLDHPDALVREEAVEGLLGRFGDVDLLGRAVRMLEDDELVTLPRTLARFVQQHAPDRYSEVMGFLIDKLLQSDDCEVQRSVYEGIAWLLQIGEPLRFESPPPDFKKDRDVDWVRLAAWLPENFEVPPEFRATREVSSPDDLATMRDDSAATPDRIAAMRRLLADHRHEARGYIQALYKAEDPELKVAALQAYIETWKTIDAASVASLLRDDSDGRQAAVDSLMRYGLELGEIPSLATSWLRKALEWNLSAATKRRAYDALLAVIGTDTLRATDESFDPDADIDWQFLDRSLARKP